MRSAVRALSAAILLAACGDDGTGPNALVPSSIQILSGAGISDTIQTSLPNPVVVLVTDASGTAVPGVIVRFESPLLQGPSGPRLGLLVSGTDQSNFVGTVIDTTDANGRAQARVRLGEVADSVPLLISAPLAGVSATARYEVRPGRPTKITLSPQDTAVYADRSYQLRWTDTDRAGNMVPSAPTFSTTGPITVTLDARVTSNAVGRARVIARVGEAADTAFVSVLPRGVIAAGLTRGDIRRTLAIVAAELDGSNSRTIFSRTLTSERGWHPMWAPAGNQLAFVGPYPEWHPYVTDLEGRDRRLDLQIPDGGIWDAQWPSYARDGSWIYFGGNPAAISIHVLWRVRPDGTGPEQLTHTTTSHDIHEYPTPSPDGTRLAYTDRNVFSKEHPTIRLLDIAARTWTDLGIADAWGLRWSPVDDRIAYIEIPTPGFTRLRIVNADGSNNRVLAEGQFAIGLDWSPDGRWIVIRRGSTLCVIDTASGELMPIPYFSDLVEPTWRR